MASANLSVRLYPETIRSLAFGSISGTYTGIGTAFANPSRLLYIVNNTDVLLTFSFDGINDHFVIFNGGFLLLDVTTNRSEAGGALNISQGTRIYVKGSPTMNSVYVSTFYGSNAL